MDLLDELLSLDRPYYEFEFKFGRGPVRKFYLRNLSSDEKDALELIYNDTWNREIVRYTDEIPGKKNELDKTRALLIHLPREQIVSRIMAFRASEIQESAAHALNMTVPELRTNVNNLELENREEFLESLNEAQRTAFQVMLSEYEGRETSELSDILAQMELNARAHREANIARNKGRIMHMMTVDEQGTRLFKSLEDLNKFKVETIAELLAKINLAVLLAEGEGDERPLDSPDDQEPSEATS